MKIIDVTADNVEERGFFCLMSRRKSTGYQRKLKWLRARFDEGLQIKTNSWMQRNRPTMNEPRVVVVTGATRGIGRALTDQLVELGHTVIGCGRSPDGIDSV
jgi:hypothetical protein